MGESHLIRDFQSENELVVYAAKSAVAWRARGCAPLIVALGGDLGVGKTTWVRGMLRGLGHTGRVPSPTYTLLEHYELPNLSVVHLDLYRLGSDEELEQLGLRDWLESPSTWLLVEWPDRAPGLAARCDLKLELSVTGPASRQLVLVGKTAIGHEALAASRDMPSS
jgi:tRNA threonylcarbamoyladenosine biosynthesis protein TsaE